jgi:AbrB family looped-hinge helix DNA binding protein
MPRQNKSQGFQESRQPGYNSGFREDLLRAPPKREKLKLGEGGRVVIPAAMREEMGVTPGETLIAHVEDGELRLVSRRMALRQVQAEVAKHKKPGENVVDEFLAERRAMWGEE